MKADLNKAELRASLALALIRHKYNLKADEITQMLEQLEEGETIHASVAQMNERDQTIDGHIERMLNDLGEENWGIDINSIPSGNSITVRYERQVSKPKYSDNMYLCFHPLATLKWSNLDSSLMSPDTIGLSMTRFELLTNAGTHRTSQPWILPRMAPIFSHLRRRNKHHIREIDSWNGFYYAAFVGIGESTEPLSRGAIYCNILKTGLMSFAGNSKPPGRSRITCARLGDSRRVTSSNSEKVTFSAKVYENNCRRGNHRREFDRRDRADRVVTDSIYESSRIVDIALTRK